MGDQRLQPELRRKDKALAEAATLLIASKKNQCFWGEAEDCLRRLIGAGSWRSSMSPWWPVLELRTWQTFLGRGLARLQRSRRQFTADGGFSSPATSRCSRRCHRG